MSCHQYVFLLRPRLAMKRWAIKCRPKIHLLGGRVGSAEFQPRQKWNRAHTPKSSAAGAAAKVQWEQRSHANPLQDQGYAPVR